MNWKDIASAGKSIGKLDSLDVNQSTKDTMEAVMCAMAASGRVQEMGLIAQTLEKVDTQADLKQVSADLGQLVAIMKAKEAPKANNRLEHFVDNDIEQLKADKAMLESRIAALETK